MNGKNRHRIENARRLMKRLDRDPLHAEQVRYIALRLFDSLGKLHGMGDRHRECLEAAALLHDIGYSRGSSGHHKHAATLIMKHGIAGFGRRELPIIALTARYHRKGGPRESHGDFNALPRAERDAVAKLSALLQIADGLDRSHGAVVRDLSATARGNEVHLTLYALPPCELELWGMEKKAGLFREVFGKAIVAEVSVVA
ncbi:MAG: HD domain-containing protein [Spirochaetes bacterium]|nr:HD domain-containing protein [Spirochaetota bacterium]